MEPVRDLVRRYLADEPYRRLTPDELWVRFRDHRDESALRVLLERLGSRIYQRCRAILHDDALAEETFQDTFVELVRQRAKLLSYGAMAAWLYQTATNKSRAVRRWRWRMRRRERLAAVPAAVASSEDQREEQAAVVEALAALPDRERRAVELVYLEGMTHDAAATALGWSRGSVGTYIQRGLGRLRHSMVRRGLASLAGGGAVEALLAADVPGLPPDRLWRLTDGVWTRLEAPAPVAETTPFLGKKAWVGLGIMFGAVAVGGLVWSTRSPPAPSPPAATPESETLQARNLRLVHEHIAPKLLAELRANLPPENPPHLVDVRAYGSAIECEFAVESPLLKFPEPARLRVSYCLHRRRMEMNVDLAGNSNWRPVDLTRPIILDPGIPGIPILDTGHEPVKRAKAILDSIASDPRTERELVRRLFGEPGPELVLPTTFRDITSVGERRYLSTHDHALFVRSEDHRWHYDGECSHWFLTAIGDTLFCESNGAIWRRPANAAMAPWERWCDDPPVDFSKNRIAHMTIAGEQILFATSGEGTHVWSKPVKHRAAPWVRMELIGHPRFLTGTAEWLFCASYPELFLLRRPAKDPAAPWERLGSTPPNTESLTMIGEEVMTIPSKPGPLYARHLSDSANAGWKIVGRLHDPGR